MNIRGLRIALFTGAYNHIADGVSLTLNRLVGYLEQQGATVQVYAPTVSKPALQHAGKLVPVPSMSAPGRPEYRVSLGLGGRAHSTLTEFNPHLFHIATPDLLGLSGLRLGKRARKPVVASYHTHFASYLDYYRIGFLENATWSYLRWFYRQCLQVYVPTASMIEVLEANRIKGNLRLWPRGVDSTLFNPSRRSEEWRKARGIEPGVPTVTFVSRLVAEKGLNVLVEVLQRLAAQNTPHRAIIVGEGPERQALEARLPDAVFEGHQSGEGLAIAYASSDIFLFPSETETFGNVTLEALASGLPAVVANATGSNALVKNGVNGFLATPRNGPEFFEKVELLIRDTALRARMGHEARLQAEEYDWSRVLGQIASYYEEIP